MSNVSASVRPPKIDPVLDTLEDTQGHEDGDPSQRPQVRGNMEPSAGLRGAAEVSHERGHAEEEAAEEDRPEEGQAYPWIHEMKCQRCGCNFIGGIAELEEKLTVEEGQFVELSAGIDEEIKAAETKQASLESQREERLGSNLNVDALSLYRRLLEARSGQAMALSDGQVCRACFMALPPNMNVQLARGKAVIQCPSCDRILFKK